METKIFGTDSVGRQSTQVFVKSLHSICFLFSAEGFQFFAKHRLFLAGISFAMLYLTVLGQDSITISFVKASGVGESLVSIASENMELMRYSSFSLVFSWECVVWSVSLAVLLFPFSGSNLGHLTLHS